MVSEGCRPVALLAGTRTLVFLAVMAIGGYTVEAGVVPRSGTVSPSDGESVFFLLGLTTGEEGRRNQPPDVSEVCLNHSIQYEQYVRELLPPSPWPGQSPMWSIQMLDATGKIPTGILEGNVKWLGSFSECLKIRVDDSHDGHFSGQYCTIKFHNKTDPNTTDIGTWIQSAPGMTDMLIEAVSVDICWPSTCNETEIELMLQYFGSTMPLESTIVHSSCQVDHPKSFDASTIAVITLYSIFGAMMLAGTLHEVIEILRRKIKPNRGDEEDLIPRNEPRIGIFGKILLSFSVYKNGKKVLDTGHSRGNEHLSCVHGLRFISMLWVILGHTFDFLMSLPFKNMMAIKDLMNSWAFNVVLSGTYAVDTFLFVSGFLITYLGLQQLKKANGRMNFLHFYLHRIWRLTPVLAMVVAFVAGPFYIMGRGPQWPIVLSAQTNCRYYWWRTLLYINNLYDTEHMCVEVSWYLSVDMQYYLLMPFLLLALYHKPILGLSAIGVLFLTTILTPALYIHYHDIPGFSDLQVLFQPNAPASVDYSANVYIKPWCRMAPYLVGMLIAYYLYKKERNVVIHWISSLIGWLVATTLALTLVYGTYHYYAGDKVMSNALNSIYGSLSKPAWGIAVGWVVLVCVTGHGGYINTLLSWKAFVPLGRLSYCCYLVHLYVMLFLYETQESVYYYNNYLVVLLYLGIVSITLMVSFVLSLAFEAPMIELEKLLIPRPREESSELQFLTIDCNETTDYAAIPQSATPSPPEQQSHP